QSTRPTARLARTGAWSTDAMGLRAPGRPVDAVRPGSRRPLRAPAAGAHGGAGRRGPRVERCRRDSRAMNQIATIRPGSTAARYPAPGPAAPARATATTGATTTRIPTI